MLMVFAQELDPVVGDGSRRVVVRARWHGRKFLVVLKMYAGAEKTTLVLQIIRAVESGSERHAVDVPLAGVIALVTVGLE